MSAVPFHLMVEPFTKFVPLAVIVKEPPPAVALFGNRLIRVGRGLLLLMVNVSAVLVPPPGNGVKTVTAAVPTVVILDAGTAAVN